MSSEVRDVTHVQSPIMLKRHKTFIRFGESVTLEKCVDADSKPTDKFCCPFCDPLHFKATDQYEVHKHLERLHWPLGVQFKDIFIVECFLLCQGVTEGHFHCPLCPEHTYIRQREKFIKHLQNHLKDQKERINLAYAPDSEQPPFLMYKDFLIEICEKKCDQNLNQAGGMKHYHCPVCTDVIERSSLMASHLRQCLVMKNRDPMSLFAEERQHKLSDPRKTFGKNWHKSFIRDRFDLPVSPCSQCCEKMFHCPLCTKEKCMPTTLSELQKHFSVHLHDAVIYKDYLLLACHLDCEHPGEMVPNLHYHCPHCGLVVQSRITFTFIHLLVCSRNYTLITKNKEVCSESSKEPATSKEVCRKQLGQEKEILNRVTSGGTCTGKTPLKEKTAFHKEKPKSSETAVQGIKIRLPDKIPLQEEKEHLDKATQPDNVQVPLKDMNTFLQNPEFTYKVIPTKGKKPTLERKLGAKNDSHTKKYPASNSAEKLIPKANVTEIQMFDSVFANLSSRFVNAFKVHYTDAVTEFLTEVAGATGVEVCPSPGTDPRHPTFGLKGSLDNVLKAEAYMYNKFQEVNKDKTITLKPSVTNLKQTFVEGKEKRVMVTLFNRNPDEEQIRMNDLQDAQDCGTCITNLSAEALCSFLKNQSLSQESTQLRANKFVHSGRNTKNTLTDSYCHEGEPLNKVGKKDSSLRSLNCNSQRHITQEAVNHQQDQHSIGGTCTLTGHQGILQDQKPVSESSNTPVTRSVGRKRSSKIAFGEECSTIASKKLLNGELPVISNVEQRDLKTGNKSCKSLESIDKAGMLSVDTGHSNKHLGTDESEQISKKVAEEAVGENHQFPSIDNIASNKSASSTVRLIFPLPKTSAAGAIAPTDTPVWTSSSGKLILRDGNLLYIPICKESQTQENLNRAQEELDNDKVILKNPQSVSMLKSTSSIKSPTDTPTEAEKNCQDCTPRANVPENVISRKESTKGISDLLDKRCCYIPEIQTGVPFCELVTTTERQTPDVPRREQEVLEAEVLDSPSSDKEGSCSLNEEDRKCVDGVFTEQGQDTAESCSHSDEKNNSMRSNNKIAILAGTDAVRSGAKSNENFNQFSSLEMEEGEEVQDISNASDQIDQTETDSMDAECSVSSGDISLQSEELLNEVESLKATQNIDAIELANDNKTIIFVNESHKCKICGHEYAKPVNLYAHIMFSHFKYKCPICKCVFTKKENLAEHLKTRCLAVAKFRCGECMRRFKERPRLDKHQHEAHGAPIHCSLCGEAYIIPNIKGLREHLYMHLQGHASFSSTVCDVCGKSFSKWTFLIKHRKRHFAEKHHMCSTCGKCFKDNSSLKEHESTIHQPEGERQYRFTCATCGRGFSRKQEFLDHQNRHSGQMPHECKHCGEKFAELYKCKDHEISKHSEDRPFACEICEKGFKLKKNLRHHKRKIHNTEGKYKCSHCQKAFRQHKHLKSHMPNCGKADSHENSVDQTSLTATSALEELGRHITEISFFAETSDMSEVQQTVEIQDILSDSSRYMCTACNEEFEDMITAEIHILHCEEGSNFAGCNEGM